MSVCMYCINKVQINMLSPLSPHPFTSGPEGIQTNVNLLVATWAKSSNTVTTALDKCLGHGYQKAVNVFNYRYIITIPLKGWNCCVTVCHVACIHRHHYVIIVSYASSSICSLQYERFNPPACYQPDCATSSQLERNWTKNGMQLFRILIIKLAMDSTFTQIKVIHDQKGIK